jgi:hypothetical protein
VQNDKVIQRGGCILEIRIAESDSAVENDDGAEKAGLVKVILHRRMAT